MESCSGEKERWIWKIKKCRGEGEVELGVRETEKREGGVCFSQLCMGKH